MEKENNTVELVPFVVTARAYYTTITEKFKKRKVWEKPVQGEIKASLPGTVLNIKVKVGDSVNLGKELMKFEAMKMQNTVVAPCDGVVADILVSQGEILKKSQLMIVIKPE